MTKIQEYAKLLVKVGVNLQKDQTLVISATVECAELVRLLAQEAYAAGAREVVHVWQDDVTARLWYLNAADDLFDSYPKWRQEFYEYYSSNNAAFLHVSASDPEALKGCDPDRQRRFRISSGEANKAYNKRMMSSENQWLVASYPTTKWAMKAFPHCETEEAAIDCLWDAIYETMRITGDGQANARWQEHLDATKRRSAYLNEMNFKTLHYKNSLGTDLTIELPENHFWLGAGEESKKGVFFVANMPTEEIFTLPKKTGVNGVVCASMPLVLMGDIVENIKFTFKDGKITKAEASKGQELLDKAITVDEGAAYLGEVALVQHDSPISRMNLLFYNTLFDENASCHLAFGEAYPLMRGTEGKSEEELIEMGVNQSKTHIDFMIGTPDLSITGVTHDGQEVTVFKDGNFVF